MSKFRYEIQIFGLILLTFLAPVARLVKYNQNYFELTTLEYGIYLLVASGSGYLISFFLRIIVGKKGLLVIAMLALITSVVIVYFIPISLGVIDGICGKPTFALRQEARYVMWLFPGIAFILYIFRKTNAKKYIAIGSKFACLYVLVFSGYALLSIDRHHGFTGTRYNTVGLPLSATKNIFVISFDQVQGSLFNGLIEENESIRRIYDDFVFYADATSTYPNTNYSLASMYLGRSVNNSSEHANFAIDSEESFLNEISKVGFSVYTGKFPGSKNYKCLTCKSPNYNLTKALELFRHTVNLTLGHDITPFYKHISTQIFKNLSLDLSDYAWKNDLHLINDLLDRSYIESNKPALFVFHFLGSHQPFNLLEDCSVIDDAQISAWQNPEGAKNTLKCLSLKISLLKNALKEKGVYNNSEIFVFSDHGYELNINNFLNDSDSDRYFHNGANFTGESNIKPAGAYNPMLLHKPANYHGNFVTSDLPASLVDIASTICDGQDCKRKYKGAVLSKIKSKSITRTVWLYFGGSVQRIKDCKDRLHNGLDRYWKKINFSGPIYPNLAISMGLDIKTYSYDLGTVVDFSKNIYYEHNLGKGWSGREDGHLWTEGSSATIAFRNVSHNSGKDLRLKVYGAGFVPNGSSSQEITVIVNGISIATWNVNQLGWYETNFSSKLIDKNRNVHIKFVIKEPTAPCDITDSKDCRKLGLSVHKIVIVEAPLK
jgi:hypothetical protein